MSMKVRSLTTLITITVLLLTACQSKSSKEANESLEVRANQAESERDALKSLTEETNTTVTDQETNASNFGEHETVQSNDLPNFLDDKGNINKDMVSTSCAALIVAGVDPDQAKFVGFENYEEIKNDEGKQNAGFRVDLIFKTNLRNLSCVVYYFYGSNEWTYVGVKNYENLHWYTINEGMGADIPLYDYETDMPVK